MNGKKTGKNTYASKMSKQQAGTMRTVQMLDDASNILYTVVRKVGY